ncbi:aspartate kinase [Mucilaginibacter phyllosphaerae]|uniref:aspartate kinase n=1 Tax=Mucilaginibacter phyllosphaerae TaxID=1812349 RepID=A0A4Y8A902_9SPHI|nr:aspartate kinase [Mucilaginibacter phyllosphaerae]MBB3970737.1 aspartate kinase [Mucilaginibacter phyllosphaerae]TEW64317.1 aspartate kinase [Mucilaginibacter phyllosphaerae]GGH04323.1 aspartate kinase [Mucilaginibacter phyllosphaerae]
MLTVEKIGGTSMSALNQVIDNIILYQRSGNDLYNRVFVVSAFSGVTNLLLENKKTKAPGVYHRLATQQDYHTALAEVTLYLKQLNERYADLGLDITEADKMIDLHMAKAKTYLDSATTMLASGYLNEGILLAAREILASIGETHSAYVLASILKRKGINTELVDLSGFDDPRVMTINERIRDAFKNIDLQTCICIATGYAKGTEGIMREFDRGYSEVTFSKIAEILRPVEAVIHKEYHLSTADPGLVGIDNVRPVGNTNYDIADQLADVGMEAIHPKAAKPLEMAGVHLRIKNTFEPAHPGTLITREYISDLKRVEVITGTGQQLLVDIYDPLMIGNVGSDLQIMQLFYNHKVSYTFKSTSANSISIIIWENDYNALLIDDLKSQFEKVTCEPVAMVCLLGTNMDQPGLLARSASALAKNHINIIAAGMASGRVNIQFVVAREQFKEAIIALNKEVG